MNKKLPKVFQNKIEKSINNNDKLYYSANKEKNSDTSENITSIKNINKKINEIFTSSTYVYKAIVEIKTNTDTFTTKIIGRNKKFLITMDNKTIPIKEIIDINVK